MGFFDFLRSPSQESRCDHRWYPVHVQHYLDTSYGGKAKSSNVISRCTRCGDLKEKSFYGAGFLDLKALQAMPLVKEIKIG